ncbi:hypothetical protein C8F01DRAFT_1089873 [Mycena amicta]|nr:hypothetical protein C8F01DRAFT_1089873 [Mycena amicta]
MSTRKTLVPVSPLRRSCKRTRASRRVSEYLALVDVFALDTGFFVGMDWEISRRGSGETVKAVAFSYDVGCQWKVLLPVRADHLKSRGSVTTDLGSFEMQFALPVWHAAAHEINCRTANALGYAVGVGKTDGEGIERTWSVLNPIGWATKEMGEGARHDTIEDKVDHMNFEKNIGQGKSLARKLVIAIAESRKQDEEFRELDESINDATRKRWQDKVSAWRIDASKPNPYLLDEGKEGGQTQKRIMEELKAAEVAEACAGQITIVEGKMTAAAFIEAGLQLEDAQRRIIAETKNKTLLTADRSSQIQELRFSLYRKYKTFSRLQLTYMPGVEEIMAQEEAQRTSDAPPPKAEEMKLYLPSQLPRAERGQACVRGVVNAEVALRVGQCGDALVALRACLHTQAHLIYWRNTNSVGQRGATRSATLLSRVKERIDKAAAKYRQARAALVALKGDTYMAKFKPLLDQDINARPGVENDIEAMKRLASADSSRASRNEPTQGTLHRAVSWIWSVGGGSELHDYWSKPVKGAVRDVMVEDGGLFRDLLDGNAEETVVDGTSLVDEDEVFEGEALTTEMTARYETRSRRQPAAGTGVAG